MKQRHKGATSISKMHRESSKLLPGLTRLPAANDKPMAELDLFFFLLLKSEIIMKTHYSQDSVDKANKTKIKISFPLSSFQIPSWTGWNTARVTSTLSSSHYQNPEVEMEPWKIQMLIGRNSPRPLTSWLLTLQWPRDKDHQHGIQYTKTLTAPGEAGPTQICSHTTSRPHVKLKSQIRSPKMIILM